MCVSLCVIVPVFIFVYVFVCVSVYLPVNVCVSVCVCVCVCEFVCVRVCVCMQRGKLVPLRKGVRDFLGLKDVGKPRASHVMGSFPMIIAVHRVF